MKSIAIDPQGNTLLRRNGRLQFTETRLEYLQQKIRSVLSLFLGEWYLDGSVGIPYLPPDTGKTAHRALIESRVQTKLMAIAGIKKLLYFTPEYDPRSRTVVIHFAVETEEGETLERSETWTTG